MNKPSENSHLNSLKKFRDLTIKIRVGVIAAIFAVIGVALIDFHRNGKETEPKVQALSTSLPGTFRPDKSQLAGLKILPVQACSFRDEYITDGTIVSNDDRTTPVFSPFTGHVTQLFAKLGDVVHKGAPLMAVDASEFVQGQNDLTAAAGSYQSTLAQEHLAEAAQQRQHDLLVAKAGAQKDWLQSVADLAAAQSNRKSAEIALLAARNRLRILGKSDSEIAELETSHGAGNMSAEALVRAPIAGTVILRQVGLGQNIQSAAGGASNPVYTISDLSSVWLIANVRETDAPHIKIGAPIEVSVLAWPGRVFKAKIAWISPSIDPNTHRLPVRAEVDNRDGALKPQMLATFRVLSGAVQSAVGIAQSAIVYEGSQAHVFVATANGDLMLRNIKTGRTNGDLAEVTDGVRIGERIVTSGALFIDRALEGN